MTQINTIVFDIGKVLFEYSPEDLVEHILPLSPYKDIYLQDLFHANLWQELDGGLVTPVQTLDILKTKHPHLPTSFYDGLIHLIHHFAAYLPLIEGSKNIFEKLNETYPIYLLTNFQDKPFDLLQKCHPFLKQAKGQIVSAKEKCMKPEKVIYTRLINTYNLTPEKTLFIDDRPENIEAAKTIGLKGIVFKSPEHLKQDLHSFDIFIH